MNKYESMQEWQKRNIALLAYKFGVTYSPDYPQEEKKMIFTVIAETVDKLDKLFDLIRGIEDPLVETTPDMIKSAKDAVVEARELVKEIKGCWKKEE